MLAKIINETRFIDGLDIRITNDPHHLGTEKYLKNNMFRVYAYEDNICGHCTISAKVYNSAEFMKGTLPRILHREIDKIKNSPGYVSSNRLQGNEQ